jgi:hypothetical protein
MKPAENTPLSRVFSVAANKTGKTTSETSQGGSWLDG